MPEAAGDRVLMDGRLNLEQQKKRAKELFASWQSGDPAALKRLQAGHPRGASLKPTLAQLADAQLVLARENGFASWPKLKAHTDALREARAAAKRPDLAPDTERTLHLRCGTDIKAALKRAGFAGQFRLFADPFCQGQVRRLPLTEQITERAAFIAAAYSLYPDVALTRVQAEYAGLDDLAGFDTVALWFEHDSYDQLILAFLLQHLAARPGPRLVLICAETAPAVSRFVGLGQLAPEVIRLLWQDRQDVTQALTDLGRQVWMALTDPSPESLAGIARSGTPQLPQMAGALQRHLQELPWVKDGLSLTQRLTLQALAGADPITAKALFGDSQAAEPRPFLGDAMYWSELALLEAGGALLAPPKPGDWHDAWPERSVSLTAHGRAILSGEADFLGADAPVRWVGGVRIDPADPAWRWDPAAARPVFTPAKGARS